MPVTPHDNLPTFGFITVVHEPTIGHIGGFLLLNARARPIEFHCTAPVVPSRAQEILFGVTLQSYLYGDQIATALLRNSKSNPTIVLSDLSEIVEARPADKTPTLLACPDSEHFREQIDHHRSRWNEFKAGPFHVASASRHPEDRDTLQRLWQSHGDGLDLHEPFVRIRDAIREAQRPAA